MHGTVHGIVVHALHHLAGLALAIHHDRHRHFAAIGKIERQIKLNQQLTAVMLGAPGVEYQGASMSAAHADMGITLSQFNAVVEDAYLACEDMRTPYHTCNQLIAALAPFKRSIVTR